jgi:uncharacterized protein (DUF1778 family)
MSMEIPPPPPTIKTKEVTVGMRLTREDKERLQRAADKHKTSISALANYLVMTALDLMEATEE